MTTVATRPTEFTDPHAVLHVAFELGERTWKLGFTCHRAQPVRARTVPARDRAAVLREIGGAKARWGLPPTTPVVSCYEAGREGFWLHRWLTHAGVTSYVVDSAAIEVNRRARRAKTDHLDVQKLAPMLVRYHEGERRVWRLVHVPSVLEEDRRHVQREMRALKNQRTRLTNRIKGLLATQGIALRLTQRFPQELAHLCLWDGTALPPHLRTRLEREWSQVETVNGHLRAVEAERQALLQTATDRAVTMVQQLARLRGIGRTGAWVYTMEFFGWRQFRNRRQVGALAGLTPTPFQSGQHTREQGINKAGNRHVRALAIELAWLWLRYQPTSALTHWYNDRFADGGARLRRIGIVALARRLLIELWRYVETGALPEGAEVKA